MHKDKQSGLEILIKDAHIHSICPILIKITDEGKEVTLMLDDLKDIQSEKRILSDKMKDHLFQTFLENAINSGESFIEEYAKINNFPLNSIVTKGVIYDQNN